MLNMTPLTFPQDLFLPPAVCFSKSSGCHFPDESWWSPDAGWFVGGLWTAESEGKARDQAFPTLGLSVDSNGQRQWRRQRRSVSPTWKRHLLAQTLTLAALYWAASHTVLWCSDHPQERGANSSSERLSILPMLPRKQFIELGFYRTVLWLQSLFLPCHRY